MTYQEEIQPALPKGTPLTLRQQRQLMQSLNPSRVATLSKGRTSLSYLEAWDVKATLIRVFGFGGFSAEADECEFIRIENNIPRTEWKNNQKTTLPIEFDPDGQIKHGTANFRVSVRVRVKLTIHQLGAVYTEWAACSQTGPDLGDVSDFAVKTAESDALKRAAVYLGTQFGLSLYASDKDHVHYADVVQNVLAPGQEFPPSPAALAKELDDFHRATLQGPYAPKQTSQTPEQEVGMLENIVHGQRPGPVMVQPGNAAEIQQMMENDPRLQEPVPSHHGESSLTPEQRAHTESLIERGLQMKRANGDPQIDNGPAGVLDRSLDERGDEVEAMAAADGHHE